VGRLSVTAGYYEWSHNFMQRQPGSRPGGLQSVLRQAPIVSRLPGGAGIRSAVSTMSRCEIEGSIPHYALAVRHAETRTTSCDQPDKPVRARVQFGAG